MTFISQRHIKYGGRFRKPSGQLFIQILIMRFLFNLTVIGKISLSKYCNIFKISILFVTVLIIPSIRVDSICYWFKDESYEKLSWVLGPTWNQSLPYFAQKMPLKLSLNRKFKFLSGLIFCPEYNMNNVKSKVKMMGNEKECQNPFNNWN